MRKLAPLLVVAAFVLAGCSGSDDGTSTTDASSSATTSATATKSTTTTQAKPNQYPVLVLNVSVDGVPGNVTTVGGNLTFDASKSYDPDGEPLSAVAVALTDANGTLPARILVSSAGSTPQTFTMRVPGPVNVTASAVDKRNGLTTYRTHAYVNAEWTLGEGADFQGALPAQVAQAESCKGATGVAQLDAPNWASRPFAVHAGTSYVTATFVSGTGEIALCAPDGTAISDAATEGTVTSKDGTVFAVPKDTSSYFVSVYSGAPNQSVVVQVTVHSEPKA